ncbi:MAG: phosphatase PAP2 family protein [Ramlibacter sp.]
MTLNRAALVGPYQGPTLPFTMPEPLDKPERLERWEHGVRLEVCSIETVSGLNFSMGRGKETFVLSYADLGSRKIVNKPLVRMTRPDAAIFQAQCGLVSQYADLREERGAEILAEMTPPIEFWGSIIGLQAHRHKWTLELLDLAFSLVVHVHMRFKHAFACPRPTELSPQIQSMIPIPGHPSLPSGHATEAYLVCTVLQSLLNSAQPGNGKRYHEQLQRLAARIAVNRTVAGLHYPVDSAAGRLLGTAIGEFFIARCKESEPLTERGFDGARFHGAKLPGKGQFRALDFDPRVSLDNGTSGYYQVVGPFGEVPVSPLLAFMWEKARKEWLPLK